MFIFHRRLHEQERLSRPLKFIKGKTTETDSQRRLVCPHSHDSIYVNPGFTDEVRFIMVAYLAIYNCCQSKQKKNWFV